MKPQIILIGAPGCGKGTISGPLVQRFGYQHISTGDLLRSEVKKQSELGLKISDLMKSGALVGDEIVFSLLSANCDLEKSFYIFDGFPRTLNQASMLQESVIKKTPYFAAHIKVENSVIIERLVNRRSCPSCGAIYNLKTLKPQNDGICDKCSTALVHRSDDKEDVIANRLAVFESTFQPIVDFYSRKDKLITLDGSLGTEKLLNIIEQRLNIN